MPVRHSYENRHAVMHWHVAGMTGAWSNPQDASVQAKARGNLAPVLEPCNVPRFICAAHGDYADRRSVNANAS